MPTTPPPAAPPTQQLLAQQLVLRPQVISLPLRPLRRVLERVALLQQRLHVLRQEAALLLRAARRPLHAALFAARAGQLLGQRLVGHRPHPQRLLRHLQERLDLRAGRKAREAARRWAEAPPAPRRAVAPRPPPAGRGTLRAACIWSRVHLGVDGQRLGPASEPQQVGCCRGRACSRTSSHDTYWPRSGCRGLLGVAKPSENRLLEAHSCSAAEACLNFRNCCSRPMCATSNHRSVAAAAQASLQLHARVAAPRLLPPVSAVAGLLSFACPLAVGSARCWAASILGRALQAELCRLCRLTSRAGPRGCRRRQPALLPSCPAGR